MAIASAGEEGTQPFSHASSSCRKEREAMRLLPADACTPRLRFLSFPVFAPTPLFSRRVLIANTPPAASQK